MRQVIVRNPAHDDDQSTTIAILKGIDPRTEPTVSTLTTKISSAQSLTNLLQKNTVLMGTKMAEQLALKPGESIEILFSPTQSAGTKISLEADSAYVAATFFIGIDEFDSNFLLCSLEYFETLFPETAPTHISLKLTPEADEISTLHALHDRLQLEIYSWKDLYPALVATLTLEKYVSFIILALVTLVASMNIVSLIFMMITHKRSDIAILLAMGESLHTIRYTFLLIGTGIATAAALCGLTIAYICGFALTYYPFITLPDCYYTSHLPIAMSFPIFVVVFLVVVVLSIIGTCIGLKHIKKITIVTLLRSQP